MYRHYRCPYPHRGTSCRRCRHPLPGGRHPRSLTPASRTPGRSRIRWQPYTEAERLGPWLRRDTGTAARCTSGRPGDEGSRGSQDHASGARRVTSRYIRQVFSQIDNSRSAMGPRFQALHPVPPVPCRAVDGALVQVFTAPDFMHASIVHASASSPSAGFWHVPTPATFHSLPFNTYPQTAPPMHMSVVHVSWSLQSSFVMHAMPPQ